MGCDGGGGQGNDSPHVVEKVRLIARDSRDYKDANVGTQPCQGKKKKQGKKVRSGQIREYLGSPVPAGKEDETSAAFCGPSDGASILTFRTLFPGQDAIEALAEGLAQPGAQLSRLPPLSGVTAEGLESWFFSKGMSASTLRARLGD